MRSYSRGRLCFISVLLAAGGTALVEAQSSFVNWETPHVSPLALSADGARLFAVNTPDNRLEIFDVTTGTPVPIAVVAVGLDPVSVRVLDAGEVWVVNHVSDSISRVDVAAGNVIGTLSVGDEPTDVVFAQGRAFVTLSQLNQVKVYDLADLAAAPTTLTIEGEDPRALAVSPDGSKVYAAIFESGNSTTILDRFQVSSGSGPYGGQNPPPNSGNAFVPPMPTNPPNPPPPQVALIVRKDPATGQWKDDNDRNWSSFVTWNLHDHDIAVIDASTLAVTYIPRLMNLNMHLAVGPTGQIAVVGTEATNEIRFEPNISGTFVRSHMAIIDPANPTAPQIFDLNPHLADEYAANSASAPPAERVVSIADPRGVAWRSDGARYVSGMGSNNVALVGAAGARLATIVVGAGPTGLALDEARDRLYVLNKFDGTVSAVQVSSAAEAAVVPFHDPTPPAIRAGRPFLYDAPLTSGLGVTACASCHIDSRMDPLSWDLGDPSGRPKTFNQFCQAPGQCENWHPMKGPMRTQSLQGLPGTGPLHWRGDRENLAAFNPAFVGLLGADAELSAADMQAFSDFLTTIKYPPNPNRNVDNTLKTALGDGNPALGLDLFVTRRFDGGALTCVQCHTLATGTNGQITPAGVMNSAQSMKVAQLRNMFDKAGFLRTSSNNNLGFGFTHDGSVDTLVNFLTNPVFQFSPGGAGMQERRDIAAFLLSFSIDTHAGVGVQVTLDGVNNNDAAAVNLINQMVSLANTNAVGLVVKGIQAGAPRGYRYGGANLFQADAAGQTISLAALRAAATTGNELTWTLVPAGSQTRIGIDRDLDGALDYDEVTGCGDPANAAILPGHFLACDSNCSGSIDFFDIDPFLTAVFDPIAYQLQHPNCNLRCNNDANQDGNVDFFDIDGFLACLFG